jgi:hypothetical protein
MKTKRIITLLLALLTVCATLVSTACGEFGAAEWYEDNGKTYRSAVYSDFSDEKYYEIDVDGKIDMSVKVETRGGDNFFAEIYSVETQTKPVYTLVIFKNESGTYTAKVNYGGEETETVLTSNSVYQQNIVIAGADDDFVIHVKGQKHTGNYKFDW